MWQINQRRMENNLFRLRHLMVHYLKLKSKVLIIHLKGIWAHATSTVVYDFNRLLLGYDYFAVII